MTFLSDTLEPERPEPAPAAPSDDGAEAAAAAPLLPSSVARFRSEHAAVVAEADRRRAARRRFVRRWWAVPVVLVLLAGAGLFVLLYEPSPETVVAEYLETVRSGDVEAALKYTEDLKGLDTASKDFLTADALRDDWSVTRIAERASDSAHSTNVDVTLTGADGATDTGRFGLTETGDDWTIDNPLVELDTSAMPVDFAQFNDVTSTDEVIWLFPGVYTAFGDVADLFDPDLPSLVAVPWPQDAGGSDVPARAMNPVWTPADAFDELLDAQLRDWIDDCAARAELAPDDCAFVVPGQDDYEPAIRTNADIYTDVDEVEWQIDEYPTAEAIGADESFDVYTVTQGEMTLTATGTSADDGEDVDITAVCDLNLDGMSVNLLPEHKFRFSGYTPRCELRET